LAAKMQSQLNEIAQLVAHRGTRNCKRSTRRHILGIYNNNYFNAALAAS